jgi:hypothetical protein
MLKYADLTKGQKRCVDAFVEQCPELDSADTVTTKQIQKVFWEIHETRAAGSPKIGYPLWLNVNSVQRGMFAWPGPNSTGQVEAAKTKLKQILSESDPVESVNEEDFLAELRENGISV